MNIDYPRVTIGIISWNRLHYLKATLESARTCIQYPNLEWILSDNNSNEPGLRSYLDGLEHIDHKLFKTQTHADAMNQILDIATGDFLFLWPEDVQFTVRGTWLHDLVEIMNTHKFIGSMGLDYQRKRTIRNLFQPRFSDKPKRFIDECLRYRHRFRQRREVKSSSGYRVLTFGWTTPGICPSGIPSLTRTKVWKTLGPWRIQGSRSEIGLIDSSLGAEDDMMIRFYKSRMPLQSAIPLVPVAADIITDPTGCKAKVRGGFRYGVYSPPPEGDFYYKISEMDELLPYPDPWPMNFTDAVTPLGFEIPLDELGDRKKTGINTEIVFDISKNEPVSEISGPHSES